MFFGTHAQNSPGTPIVISLIFSPAEISAFEIAVEFGFNGTAVHNGDTLKINHVNYNRKENELVLYNHLQGKYTRVNEHGVEVVVDGCHGNAGHL